MTPTERMKEKVDDVMEKICENNAGLDIKRAFNVVMYSPLYTSAPNQSTTCVSLEKAVRTLLTWLEQEPGYAGKILVYRPRTLVIYEKNPTK